jgi:hypothetical protein
MKTQIFPSSTESTLSTLSTPTTRIPEFYSFQITMAKVLVQCDETTDVDLDPNLTEDRRAARVLSDIFRVQNLLSWC